LIDKLAVLTMQELQLKIFCNRLCSLFWYCESFRCNKIPNFTAVF